MHFSISYIMRYLRIWTISAIQCPADAQLCLTSQLLGLQGAGTRTSQLRQRMHSANVVILLPSAY